MSGRKKVDIDYKHFSETGQRVEKIRGTNIATKEKLKVMSTNIRGDIEDFLKFYLIPVLHEEPCEREPDNTSDRYAIKEMKDIIVGHLPRNFSLVFVYVAVWWEYESTHNWQACEPSKKWSGGTLQSNNQSSLSHFP